MMEFRTAELAIATRKLDGAAKELSHLEAFLAEKPFDVESAAMRWSAVTTVASAIHNIYNGLEDVMKAVCRSVDDHIPAGSSSHQDILDQLSVARKGIRPAVLDETLFVDLGELKRFRHRVNHNYANELREDKTLENLDLLRKIMPQFLTAMQKLDDHLSPPEPIKDQGRDAGDAIRFGIPE